MRPRFLVYWLFGVMYRPTANSSQKCFVVDSGEYFIQLKSSGQILAMHKGYSIIDPGGGGGCGHK